MTSCSSGAKDGAAVTPHESRRFSSRAFGEKRPVSTPYWIVISFRTRSSSTTMRVQRRDVPSATDGRSRIPDSRASEQYSAKDSKSDYIDRASSSECSTSLRTYRRVSQRLATRRKRE